MIHLKAYMFTHVYTFAIVDSFIGIVSLCLNGYSPEVWSHKANTSFAKSSQSIFG